MDILFLSAVFFLISGGAFFCAATYSLLKK